jgi:hypothetical protein
MCASSCAKQENGRPKDLASKSHALQPFYFILFVYLFIYLFIYLFVTGSVVGRRRSIWNTT